MDLLCEFKERGLLAQVTFEDELLSHLSSGKRTIYIGFDPTAPSLHVGHLLQIMNLARCQNHGHNVIALAGGGTALIGDPTGKTELRAMLTAEDITQNIASIKTQLAKFVDFRSPNTGIILNNYDWLGQLNYLAFLRDIGPHFTVNRMLAAECFKQRWEKGLTFLEFNYMLLQSYDFLELYSRHNCTVQMGGDDQWSNMLAGVDLIRRVKSGKAFCLTTPLLTTPDGKKMGKTEKGAVWLDPHLTSPFEYFQYWRNVDDAVVEKCLSFFTFLPIEEVRRLGKIQGKDINEAKKILAYECTKLLHGEQFANEALSSAESIFSNESFDPAHVPTIEVESLNEGQPLVDVLLSAGIFSSKGEARRMIQQGGICVFDERITDPFAVIVAEWSKNPQGIVFKKGKKNFYRVIKRKFK